MAISKITIINAAVLLVGAEKLTALTDNRRAARLADSMYELARNEVFDFSIDFKFATARAELSQLSTAPAFGRYDYQYELPSGCRRVIAQIDEGDDGTEYECRRELWVETSGNKEIEHDVLLTNEDEAFIKYIRIRENEAKWPAWFAKLVILNLALYLCEPLKQDKQKKNQIWLMLYDPEDGAYKKAKEANGKEDVDVSSNNVRLDKGNTDVVDAASGAEASKKHIRTETA